LGVVDAWTDCDVETLTHIVRHCDGKRGISPRLLEDLRRVVGADQVLLLELDTECARLAAAAPALPSYGRLTRVAAGGWTALLDRESVAGVEAAAAKDVVVAPLASPVSDACLVFLRKDRQFEQRDHALLGLLAPHVVSAYRRLAERRTGATALTPRQRTVLHLVARGCGNEEIARRLVVSPGTVRKHLDNIFRQLGVSSRAAAVARAFPEGVPRYLPDHPARLPLPAQRTG
jgi:DNA-binding CsgD family transcriptional regulator